jgi:hypothetical protein
MRGYRWLTAGFLFVFVAACQALVPLSQATVTSIPVSTTAVPSATSTSTLSPTPMIQCTPPACWGDEAYFCPKACPGGCGTTCATRTPDPNASPTPPFPVVTFQCSVPTPGPAGGTRLSACIGAKEVKVGDTFSISAEVGQAGPVEFLLRATDIGEKVGSIYLRAKNLNRAQMMDNSSNFISLLSIQASETRFGAAFKALSPGELEISIIAMPPYPAASLDSDLFVVTVLP